MLIDWGADLLYKSDLTRTLRSPFGTSPTRRNKYERVGLNFEEIYEIVLDGAERGPGRRSGRGEGEGRGRRRPQGDRFGQARKSSRTSNSATTSRTAWATASGWSSTRPRACAPTRRTCSRPEWSSPSNRACTSRAGAASASRTTSSSPTTADPAHHSPARAGAPWSVANADPHQPWATVSLRIHRGGSRCPGLARLCILRADVTPYPDYTSTAPGRRPGLRHLGVRGGRRQTGRAPAVRRPHGRVPVQADDRARPQRGRSEGGRPAHPLRKGSAILRQRCSRRSRSQRRRPLPAPRPAATAQPQPAAPPPARNLLEIKSPDGRHVLRQAEAGQARLTSRSGRPSSRTRSSA